MNASNADVVPLWTLTTSEGASAPVVSNEEELTPERLADLRTALAAFASAPLVTLEAHALPERRKGSGGLPLHAASPLAQELSRLIATTAARAPVVKPIADSGEVLYKMVVPAKVAAEYSSGAIKSMVSKAATGGIYGDLVGDLAGGTAKSVVAKSTFVPVASAGAGGTAVGTAAGTAAAGTALTVAAPLVLMAVAVGASALAEQKRQRAIDNITDLLEKLKDDALDEERSELDGCRDAIDKATTLLLDRGRVGALLGLDSAVHEINTAISAAEHRLKKWEKALDGVVENRVGPELELAFPGILGEGGEFRTHLELAALAIALKRRVVVLQGVEAGQSDPENPFKNFVRTLKDDQSRIDDLEARVREVVLRLSALELRSPRSLVGSVMTRNQVESLLDRSYRLRALPREFDGPAMNTDVVIEIEKHSDGTLLVLPSRAA